MRYLIKYAKNSEIKFVAHLDLMRTIQRTIRRAELNVEFSKGFNPHMTLSIAQPLGVGVYSTGDYLDLVLLNEEDEKVIIEKLNENAPLGLKFIEAVKIEGKLPPSMALIEAAKYTLNFLCLENNNIEEEVKELFNKEKWEVIKSSKKGEKLVDIKPLIKDIKGKKEKNIYTLNVVVNCGSRENLSPKLLGDFIRDNCDSIDKDKFIKVKREEMYVIKDDKLVSLSQFAREKK